LDKACFEAVLDFLTSRFPPSNYKKLFEPGIGTGRIAIPLAERGYRVTGVDISENMLKILAEKLTGRKPALPVTFQIADITALPFKDGVFDIAMATHVFHLIRDWQKAMSEVIRVLKPGAPRILMFTGSGTEAPGVKERYRALCSEYGYVVRHIGMNSETNLPDFVTKIGRHIEWVRDRWRWTQRVRVDKVLADIGNKSYSSSKHVPDDVHLKVMEKLEAELKQQYGNLAVEINIPVRIDMAFILTD
jgi:ubiquinone/menaquinone biosynthesis C-methylase UbiE